MMVKAFLDTNVLMDVLQEGRPSSSSSQMIFQAVWDRKIEAVLTTQSIVDSSYLAQKAGLQKVFFEMVNKCCDYINIEQLNSFDIRFACRNYTGDFEDDSLFYRAIDCNCDVFVTSDKKLRETYQGKHKNLRIMSPEEFVSNMTGLSA